MHKFLGGALMALAGIVTMFTMQACDNNNKQYIPSVEAATESHVVEQEVVHIGTGFQPYYALYVRFDNGAVFQCVAIENSSNDSKTSAMVCK